ncbi:MAG: hypothetical protein FWC41_04820 [Firmicutes bacterium]|nr:hypothetical protein [Bacillota bacterium]
MSNKFLMEYDDFQTLIDLVQSVFDKIDDGDKNTLNNIIAKYSLKQQVNEIKRFLFEEIKEYQQGTAENKRAYNIYRRFDEYVKRQYELIENGVLSFADVNNELERIRQES